MGHYAEGTEPASMEYHTEGTDPASRQVHRVGTITLGISLVVFGILFLLHLFLPALNYQMIFHLWPCIFIFLGIEVLLGSRHSQFKLDKGAIFLVMVLALFAMIMGVVDYGMECYRAQWWIEF